LIFDLSKIWQCLLCITLFNWGTLYYFYMFCCALFRSIISLNNFLKHSKLILFPLVDQRFLLIPFCVHFQLTRKLSSGIVSIWSTSRQYYIMSHLRNWAWHYWTCSAPVLRSIVAHLLSKTLKPRVFIIFVRRLIFKIKIDNSWSIPVRWWNYYFLKILSFTICLNKALHFLTNDYIIVKRRLLPTTSFWLQLASFNALSSEKVSEFLKCFASSVEHATN